MVLGNLIFQTEVVEQRFTAVVLPHHDEQASDNRNQTEHGRMLSSNMLLRNLILLIDVTFSTPTYAFDNGKGANVNEMQALRAPKPPPPGPTDLASFTALRKYYERVNGCRFPEAELRQQWVSSSSGSVSKQRDFPGGASGFCPVALSSELRRNVR